MPNPVDEVFGQGGPEIQEADQPTEMLSAADEMAIELPAVPSSEAPSLHDNQENETSEHNDSTYTHNGASENDTNEHRESPYRDNEGLEVLRQEMQESRRIRSERRRAYYRELREDYRTEQLIDAAARAQGIPVFPESQDSTLVDEASFFRRSMSGRRTMQISQRTSSEDGRVQDSGDQDQGPSHYIDDSGRLRLSSVQEQSREQLRQFNASESQADRNENDPGVEPGPVEHNRQSRLNLLADEFREPGELVQQSAPAQQKRGTDKSRRRAFFQKMKDGFRKLTK